MDWIQLIGDLNFTRAEKQKAFETVKKLVQWSELARAEGFLALADIAEAEEDIFLKHGLLFFVLYGAEQEEWERYAAAWILSDQEKGERLFEMIIITEGLSLILEHKPPQGVLIHLGAWFGSDLAAEVERELKTMEARQYRKSQER